MIWRMFDNKAQCLWALGTALVLLSSGLILSGCEEEPGAVPPASVERVATFVADPDEQDDPDQDGISGIEDVGDFDFSEVTLPNARFVFFMHGDELWRIGQNSEPEVLLDDLMIGGFSASSRGDRVAILHFERDDAGAEHGLVSIVDSRGEAVIDATEASEAFDLSQLSPIQTLAMRPDGEALALTHQNGAMTLVELDGSAHELLPASIEHQPGRISWSSDGQFLAYLDPWMPDEPSSLYVTIPGRDIRLSLMDASTDEDGIVRARWIPGTTFVVAVRSTGSTIAHGGDLFLIDAETGRRELLMSSGTIAPVAGLADIEPSPDGQWLAATGFVPGENYPAFAGLWLIDLESGHRIEIELEGTGSVTDLWWLGEDLLIRMIDTPQTSLPGTYTGREPFRLVEIDPSTGSTTERYPVTDDDADDE
jgi:hypothetical protein